MSGVAAAVPAARPLAWSVFRNTAAQIVGRNGVAVVRLVIAAIIARRFGSGTFGEYSLLFGLLTVAEWLLDFGMTEIFVRDVCADPASRPRLLRVLAAAKLVQIPVAFAVFATVLVALRYPGRVLEAGLIGGMSLLFFAGVLVYRVVFKANLAMHLEMGAEMISVIVLVPMVLWTAASGGGLAALMACHVVSRAVFFVACAALDRRSTKLSLGGVGTADLKRSFGASAAVGTVGLLVAMYETIDILLLSKLSTPDDLAWYAGAQRLVWPMLMALASIGNTLYPLAASFWPDSRDQFERALQKAVDTVVVLAAGGVCIIMAGAEFLMGLLGKELVAGAPALRILGALCIVKAISSTIGPILYVTRSQKSVLKFISVAVLVRFGVALAVAPRYGFLGIAIAALLVEVAFAAVPSVVLVERRTGYRFRWGVAIRAIAICAAAAGGAILLFDSPAAAAAVAATAYVVLVFATRTVRIDDIRMLLRRKTA